ncbi:MAG: 2-amino-4-hydroxy-6-hydroxymethyldihydropteridine diphosphokinase [Thermodesulfobacteriota bacterium]
MVEAAIGLGSNLGDKTGQVRAALDRIGGLSQTRLLAASNLYRTAPVGRTDQDWFVNAAALVETALSAWALLEALLGIEEDLGRRRAEKWGPRLIDLDLLFYGTQQIKAPGLVVPHPYLPERRFVLEPLAEVAPGWVHPVLGLSVMDMTARLDPRGQEVHRL